MINCVVSSKFTPIQLLGLLAPMSCKTESLYTKIMEWLKEECPLLQPENMSVDFELAILNSAEEVFQVTPTGCDFHYNQAIYRKFGQMGLKPIQRSRYF